ncbi:hypothetical protein [Rhodopirellula europaea]|jgi:hypothetical protein|uniref:Uncharacterized protein n=1 Tax=Rhodopirellula europaea SH398 TaxID=1263868 RepID=M5S8C6_9BACT|nr:hypothetical protein [Rhodopirellula europaea]EMI27883.1 hypothetical protein RESH_01572 [Rhodopirellula europaea SH398]
MSVATLELRWFFQERPDWFDKAAESAWRFERSVRTDWYALIADRNSSVKLRGVTEERGRERQENVDATPSIESKILQSTDCHPIADDQSLMIERWVKHTLRTLDPSAKEDAELRQLITANWLQVRKERLLYQTPDSIQIEFATVELLGGTYWTHCIEAPTKLNAGNLVRWLCDSGQPGIAPTEVMTRNPQQSWPSWLQTRMLV